MRTYAQLLTYYSCVCVRTGVECETCVRGFQLLASPGKRFMGKDCVCPYSDEKINVPTAVTLAVLHGRTSADVVCNSTCVFLSVCLCFCVSLCVFPCVCVSFFFLPAHMFQHQLLSWRFNKSTKLRRTKKIIQKLNEDAFTDSAKGPVKSSGARQRPAVPNRVSIDREAARREP